MTSADTSHIADPTGPDNESLLRKANTVGDQDELANFSALADPNAIAGVAAQNGQIAIERENSDLVDRLRAELQRRAKQVETLSRDLSSTQSAKTDTEERLQELSHEVAEVRTSIIGRERHYRETSVPAPIQATNRAADKPKPFAAARPAAAESGSLRRLLHAAHTARRVLEEQLAERDTELAKIQKERTTLRNTVQELRLECESQAEERTQVRRLKANLETRTINISNLTEESNNLRRELLKAQQIAADAEKVAQRTKEAMGDTRNRVTAREAEASALRAALATNQIQAQARACENEELQAALSIARETLEARRTELKTSKIELAAATEKLQRVELQNSALDNELTAQQERSGQQSSELTQMNLTLPRLEQNLRDRSSEIDLLRTRLDKRDSEISEVRELLTRTQMSRDSLTDDLATEQQALARARSRGAEREATLATLRETLASIGKAATVLPAADPGVGKPASASHQAESLLSGTDERTGVETETSSNRTSDATTAPSDIREFRDTSDHAATGDLGPLPEPAEITSDNTDVTEGITDMMHAETEATSFEPATDLETLSATSNSRAGDDQKLALASLTPKRSSEGPPAIFHMWRDKQIAKKLAPLGVDGIDDYFVGCLHPLLDANRGEMTHILSLGGIDPEFELRIARSLRRGGHEGFRIHFPESNPGHGTEIVRKASQLGLDQELVPFSSDRGQALEVSEFGAIISDGALSGSKRLDSLVEALVFAANDGAMIAVSERVGIANSQTAREMGDRIWQLMPERYKLNRFTQESESNYWVEDAGLAGQADLLANLRAHFVFQDFASFGHLVDRFVSPEIGPNFNPADDRDRRFIEQIANLDEAKLDAGALEPLHIVGRLTAR